jgi:NTE family protein
MASSAARRVAIVLSGGGARGAYEAGVLSYLFEEIYPRLSPGFEFDLVSGTSVGAIHAAYLAATADEPGLERAARLTRIWEQMKLEDVIQLRMSDLLGIPLRALGLRALRRKSQEVARGVVGGLVDLTPLERIVERRIPWQHLRPNLESGRPGALCVSCTEVRSGRVGVFLDGPLADPSPWSYDPNAAAYVEDISQRHVRASAAIPFLFPSVRIGDRYYVDGGLRMNTPLSPVLRLGADRVLVIALKHDPGLLGGGQPYPEEVVTQPAFLLGKVLNALLLDQLEYEIQRVDLVNAWIEHGSKVYGEDFLENINVAVRAQRGADYRAVRVVTVRPGRDVGEVADECYSAFDRESLGPLPGLLARMARRGVPHGEADLLSYLLFDRCFTSQLVAMGREDARAREADIVALLEGEGDPVAEPGR